MINCLPYSETEKKRKEQWWWIRRRKKERREITLTYYVDAAAPPIRSPLRKCQRIDRVAEIDAAAVARITPLVCPCLVGQGKALEVPLDKNLNCEPHQKYPLTSRGDRKNQFSAVATTHQELRPELIHLSPCCWVLSAPAAAIKTNCWKSTFAPSLYLCADRCYL